MLSKRCNRLPCGEPGRCRQNLPGCILDHIDVPSTVAQAREPEHAAQLSGLTAQDQRPAPWRMARGSARALSHQTGAHRAPREKAARAGHNYRAAAWSRQAPQMGRRRLGGAVRVDIAQHDLLVAGRSSWRCLRSPERRRIADRGARDAGSRRPRRFCFNNLLLAVERLRA